MVLTSTPEDVSIGTPVRIHEKHKIFVRNRDDQDDSNGFIYFHQSVFGSAEHFHNPALNARAGWERKHSQVSAYEQLKVKPCLCVEIIGHQLQHFHFPIKQKNPRESRNPSCKALSEESVAIGSAGADFEDLR